MGWLWEGVQQWQLQSHFPEICFYPAEPREFYRAICSVNGQVGLYWGRRILGVRRKAVKTLHYLTWCSPLNLNTVPCNCRGMDHPGCCTAPQELGQAGWRRACGIRAVRRLWGSGLCPDKPTGKRRWLRGRDGGTLLHAVVSLWWSSGGNDLLPSWVCTATYLTRSLRMLFWILINPFVRVICCTVGAECLWLCWSGLLCPFSAAIWGTWDLHPKLGAGSADLEVMNRGTEAAEIWPKAPRKSVVVVAKKKNSLKNGGQPPSTQGGGRRAKTCTDVCVREQRQSLALWLCQVPSMGTPFQLCAIVPQPYTPPEKLIWEGHGF